VLPAPRTELTLMLFGLADVRATEAMTVAMNGPFEVTAAAHLPAHAAHARPLKAQMPVTAMPARRVRGLGRARAEALVVALKAFGRIDQLDGEHSRDSGGRSARSRPSPAIRGPLWRLSLPPAQGWKGPHGLPGDALYDWAGGLAWLLTEGAGGEGPRGHSPASAATALCLRGGPAFGPREGALGALHSRVKDASIRWACSIRGGMDG
jgi:glycolate oxidase FAD binding subunit